MSASVVHITLLHSTANVTLKVTGKCYTRSADDLIKGISYLFSTSSLATSQPALKTQVSTGNRVKPTQLM